MNTQRLGIDLGGTKIEGVLIEGHGNIIRSLRRATPQDNYAAILQTIKEVVDDLSIDQPGQTPVGIGTPGSPSPTNGKMRNANSTCLNGQPLLQDLERVLDRPIKLANDADCFTLSEATDGAGEGSANVLGVILGTGTGGGLCINGQLVAGINRIAGEWGHNPLPLSSSIRTKKTVARACFCGRQNCIETWLSGPGLALSYFEATGVKISAEAIFARASSNEPLALELVMDYCDLLAVALATVINIVDPEVIVLGGGLSNVELLYQEVPKQLEHYVFSDHVATTIKPARHGDSSGVRGAAWLWPV